MKQNPKSESRESKTVPTPSNLEHAQQNALDNCVVAHQSIIELEKLAIETNQPNIGNVHDAKDFLRDAIAYLAIFASKGAGSKRIREILSKYGIEDWF